MERLQTHFMPPFRCLALLPLGSGSGELEAGRRFLRGNAAVTEFSGSEGIGLRKPWAYFAVLVGCSLMGGQSTQSCG
jgi:hypothetical protein